MFFEDVSTNGGVPYASASYISGNNGSFLPSQSLPIYCGRVSTPKDFEIFFTKQQINNETPNGIYNLKVGNKVIAGSTVPALATGWSSDIYSFDAMPSSSTFTGLNNNTSYDITFEVGTTQGNTYVFFGKNQAYFKDKTSLNNSISSGDDWLREYVQRGIHYGLFSGSGGVTSTTFGATTNLTRGQAAKVIVAAAMAAHVPGRIINTAGYATNYTDVSPSHFSWMYIHTLRNWGCYWGGATFSTNDPITIKEFCRWLDLAMQFDASDEAPAALLSNRQSRVTVAVTGPNAANFQTSMERLSKIMYKREGTSILGQYLPLVSGADISGLSVGQILSGGITVDGNQTFTRGMMAKFIVNAFEAGYRKHNGGFGPNKTGGTAGIASIYNLNDVAVIGDMFENSATPTGSAPAAPSQVTFSCASGATMPIGYPSNYDGGGNPLTFYWSMEKGGANITSATANHRSINFVAPTVTSPASFVIYSYVANNQGKVYETNITVNVTTSGGGGGGGNPLPVAPANTYMYALSASGFYIDWTTVGGVSQYQVECSASPSFSSLVAQSTVSPSGSTGSYLVTGQTSGTFYGRVRSVGTAGNSPWSNTATFSFNSNSQPYLDITTFSPANGSTISANSATLSFAAQGGNPPLSYTVWLATWNPAAQTPVLSNSTTTTYTASNLLYNQSYYWKVQVTDADGDTHISNIASFTVAPELNAPTGGILIENGAATTNSMGVTLNLNAMDTQGTVDYMRFSNDGSNWTYWYPYNTSYPGWDLSSYGGSTASGTKTVYVQYRDNSNNISTAYSDNITLAAGVPGYFIVRGVKYVSLRLANDVAIAGDTIYATAGYFDLTSEVHSSPYITYGSGAVGVGLKSGVALVGEGEGKTTLYWNGSTPMSTGIACAGNNYIKGLTLIVSNNPSYQRNTLRAYGVSNIKIENCTFKNGGYAILMGDYSGSPFPQNIVIAYCTIYGNSRAIKISSSSSVSIYNNTINTNGWACVDLYSCSSINFKNNIVSNNSAAAIAFYSNTGVIFSNNNIFNNKYCISCTPENYYNDPSYLQDQTGLNGNISQDPLYLNMTTNSYSLTSGSPCINTGVAVGYPTIGVPDMGAYEYGTSTGTLNVNSNTVSTFIVTRPNGTQTTLANGQSITGAEIGMYGIYPQDKAGYYKPNPKFVYLGYGQTVNYYGTYTLDNQGPVGKIYINGGAYSTMSPYVTIYNDIEDAINGIGPNSQMQFSNDGSTWSAPEVISNKKLLWNTGLSAAGQAIVFAKFSDNNGFWSSVIKDTIQYIPSAQIKMFPTTPAQNLSALINASTPGDVILIRPGTHSVFGLYTSMPAGITLQGSGAGTTALAMDYMSLSSGTRIDNVTISNPTSQNTYITSGNQAPVIITNTVMMNRGWNIYDTKSIFANSVFKNISSNFFGFINTSSTFQSSYKFLNNIFDASVNNSSLTQERGINASVGANSRDNFVIRNNVFQSFDVGNNSSINTAYGGIITANNSSSYVGDLYIQNNNFYNCSSLIHHTNGSPVSKDELTYTHNPQFSAGTYLPGANSALINAGYNSLFYRDHDGSANNIGINGGLYYNTLPTVSAAATSQGGNTYQFTATASDNQTPTAFLQYRWDFNNDGAFDTPFLITAQTTYTFAAGSTDSVLCWVFDEHFSMSYVKIANPGVLGLSTSVAASGTLCPINPISVSYTAQGIYAPNNIFTIQLSDPIGGWGTPLSVGSVNSTVSSSISVTLPSTLPSGTGYRVRVLSSNPATIGTESSPLAIQSISGAGATIIGLANSYIITDPGVVLIGNMPKPQWQFTINGVPANVFDPIALGVGTYTVLYFNYSNPCNQLTQYVTVTAPVSVACSVTATQLCAGTTLPVTYTFAGAFDPNNTFEVQLSDETGSFANPSGIYYLSSIGTGTAQVQLPPNLLAGTYRVRVVSSSPVLTSVASSPFVVAAAAPVSVAINVAPAATVCAGDQVTFTAAPTNGGTSPSYQWRVNGVAVGTNFYKLTLTTLADGDAVWVEMTSNAGCAPVTPAVAQPVQMAVTTVPVPDILALDNVLATSAYASGMTYQWFRNGAAIQGATTQFYDATQSGFYTVTVSLNGCSATSALYSHTYVGLENEALGDAIRVYPNPTSGLLTVQLPASGLASTVDLIDITGRILNQFSATPGEHTLDLSSLPAGVYLLRVGSASVRVVKE